MNRTPSFLILDHDAKYGTEVPAAIRSMDIAAIRTAVGCPWQNGIAERWGWQLPSQTA
jgi:transposase InsO family protein